MNARFFVQKKPPYHTARLEQLRHTLAGLPEVSTTTLNALLAHTEIWLIYDIFATNEIALETLRKDSLVDAATDIYHERLPEDYQTLAFELLPGQFDARADAARQCLSLQLTADPIPNDLEIRTGEVLIFSDEAPLDAALLEKVKSALINPVECREKDLTTLEAEAASQPSDILRYPELRSLTPEAFADFIETHGLAMSTDDLAVVQAHFAKIDRAPTETELKLLDTYWSDHCRHTTFFTEIHADILDERTPLALRESWQRYLNLRTELESQKPISLMEMGTIAAKSLKKQGILTALENSEEDNACSVIVDIPTEGGAEPWLLMFKNETHNHPTEIDPFGGAATCIGGAIRDPLSGRAYVYQAMRLTGAAYQGTDTPRLEGKLPQEKICRDAAHGYSSYGNQIGLATTLVRELYHPNYIAKRLEVGMVVGAVRQKDVRRERPAAGDVIIMIGGKTGRDGIGGATGSSKVQTSDSLVSMAAEVQKGNAPEERKIQRLFRRPEFLHLVKKSNDFGAGGVSVAIGELAESLDIQLDVIPTKYQGLNGTELAIAESQERMAIVVSAADKNTALSLAAQENLLAVHIADVTDTGHLRMYWRGEQIVDLSRDFLDTNGAARQTSAKLHSEVISLADKKPTADFSLEQWQSALKDHRVATQQSLAESFDASIGATTVLHPYGGRYQLSPEQVSAQTLCQHEHYTSLASYGFSVDLAMQSPYQAGQFAVAESIAKLIAAGAEPDKIWLSFQEYFHRLGESPSRWGVPMASLLGALDAQLGLGYAAIGGKDSMSGSYQDIDVPPTLISFAAGVAQTEQVTSATLPKADAPLQLYWLPCPIDTAQTSIDFIAYKTQLDAIHQNIVAGNISAARVVGDSGLSVSLSQMAMGNQIGFAVDDPDLDWLAPQHGGILIAANTLLDHLPHAIGIGETNNTAMGCIAGITLSLEQITQHNLEALRPLYPEPERKLATSHDPIATTPKPIAPAISLETAQQPRVAIPVFPGTNCEFDTQAAFNRAGAQTEISLIRNLDDAMLAESADTFCQSLRQSQILMLSGGFSLADEPDGAGKFIANFLRLPTIREAVQGLLARDGLILGICNGFQALIKSGLLPYGKITERQADDATLTVNQLGRHVARLANIRVTQNTSPWLAENQIGDAYQVPISHGEGRLIASEQQLLIWQQQGQIATQYCDISGNIAKQYPDNPNGSALAIEGLTSPDGRIYGRMAHPERVISRELDGKLFRNIPEILTHDIFVQGVRYFTGKNS